MTWRLWVKYSKNGKSHGWLLWLRLIYGGLGFLFMLFLTCSQSNEPRDSKPLLEPVVWYWSWLGRDLVSESPNPSDDPIPILSDSSPTDDHPQSLPSWGTDASGRNIRVRISSGIGGYVLWGSITAIAALLIGLGVALSMTWPIRPMLPEPYDHSIWRRAMAGTSSAIMDAVDPIPKFLLVLGIFAAFRASTVSFSIGMGIFLAFGIASIARGRINEYLSSEQYRYSLEIGLAPHSILWHHLIRKRLVFILLVQLPFILAAFVMWEATLSIFQFGVPGFEFNSLGLTIWDGLPSLLFYDCDIDPQKCAFWPFWIPFITTVFIISSLYVLSEAFRILTEYES